MEFAQLWHQVLMAAPAEASSLNPALGLLCVAAVVGVGLALTRMRQQRRQLDALTRQLAEARVALTKLEEKSRKGRAGDDGLREELREAKQELAAQRKK